MMAIAEAGERETGTAVPAHFIRFTLWQRIEHWLLVLSFAGLLLTGLPQKYDESEFSSWVMGLMGSVTTARFLHRVFACIFVIESLVHAGEIAVSILRRRFRPSMMITPQDFRDAFNMLRYSVGVTEDRPQFDRFDYKQKFEYWGIVFGALIMIATGAVLWFPTIVTRLLPGELVPAAKEMHSGEALLAFAVVLVWHFYDVIFSPAVLPLDTAMITGKISRERMMHEHPREFERLTGQAAHAPLHLQKERGRAEPQPKRGPPQGPEAEV